MPEVTLHTSSEVEEEAKKDSLSVEEASKLAQFKVKQSLESKAKELNERINKIEKAWMENHAPVLDKWHKEGYAELHKLALTKVTALVDLIWDDSLLSDWIDEGIEYTPEQIVAKIVGKEYVPGSIVHLHQIGPSFITDFGEPANQYTYSTTVNLLLGGKINDIEDSRAYFYKSDLPSLQGLKVSFIDEMPEEVISAIEEAIWTRKHSEELREEYRKVTDKLNNLPKLTEAIEVALLEEKAKHSTVTAKNIQIASASIADFLGDTLQLENQSED